VSIREVRGGTSTVFWYMMQHQQKTGAKSAMMCVFV